MRRGDVIRGQLVGWEARLAEWPSPIAFCSDSPPKSLGYLRPASAALTSMHESVAAGRIPTVTMPPLELSAS